MECIAVVQKYLLIFDYRLSQRIEQYVLVSIMIEYIKVFPLFSLSF